MFLFEIKTLMLDHKSLGPWPMAYWIMFKVWRYCTSLVWFRVLLMRRYDWGETCLGNCKEQICNRQARFFGITFGHHYCYNIQSNEYKMCGLIAGLFSKVNSSLIPWILHCPRHGGPLLLGLKGANIDTCYPGWCFRVLLMRHITWVGNCLGMCKEQMCNQPA